MARHHRRTMWVLEYVNGHELFGRFEGHWTRTTDIDVAALWASHGEADNARQALLSEASDRLRRDDQAHRFWFDIHGGVVAIREVEIITRVVDHAA